MGKGDCQTICLLARYRCSIGVPINTAVGMPTVATVMMLSAVMSPLLPIATRN